MQKDDRLEGELLKKRAGGDQARRAYKKGYEFETRVRKALQRAGWWVHRMHQSRGAMDLIGLCPLGSSTSHSVFVQCKAYSEVSLPKIDRFRLMSEAEKAGAAPLLAIQTKGGVVNFYRLMDADQGVFEDWSPVF